MYDPYNKEPLPPKSFVHTVRYNLDQMPPANKFLKWCRVVEFSEQSDSGIFSDVSLDSYETSYDNNVDDNGNNSNDNGNNNDNNNRSRDDYALHRMMLSFVDCADVMETMQLKKQQ